MARVLPSLDGMPNHSICVHRRQTGRLAIRDLLLLFQVCLGPSGLRVPVSLVADPCPLSHEYSC